MIGSSFIVCCYSLNFCSVNCRVIYFDNYYILIYCLNIAWPVILASGISIVWIVSIPIVRIVSISVVWRVSRSIIWRISISRIWLGSVIWRKFGMIWIWSWKLFWYWLFRLCDQLYLFCEKLNDFFWDVIDLYNLFYRVIVVSSNWSFSWIIIFMNVLVR